MGTTFEHNRELVNLESNPGLFYAGLGEAVASHSFAGVLDHLQVAAWCFREAAEVHEHPGAMHGLGNCYHSGEGVTEDPAQAVAWYQKAADLGHHAGKAALGAYLLNGDSRAGVAKDAARGFELFHEAVELGFGASLYQIARCYLTGEGVEEDADHAVGLLRQVIDQVDASRADAQVALAICYKMGHGVETDTAQAAIWCQRAADGGDTGPSRCYHASGRAPSAAQRPPASTVSVAGRCATATPSARRRTGSGRRTRTRVTAAAQRRHRSTRRRAARPRRRSRNVMVRSGQYLMLIYMTTFC